MPSPRPNGISTAVIELRSRARVPSNPMIAAATTEPTSDPATTPIPSSSPAAAPAKDSSLMPWTAKARSRCVTKTPMRPPTTPRIAPANTELRSRPSNSP